MRAAMLLLLVLALPALAQVKGPAEVSVPVGRLASVPLTVDGDESDYVILGTDIDAFREYDPDPKKLRLRVIGYSPGIAYAAVASQKGGKLNPLFTVKIICGTGPPSTACPGPGPGPTPIPPADPLAMALKDAAKADGWPAVKLSALGIGFKVSADRVASRETAGDLYAMLAATLKDNSPDKTPANVRAVLARELMALDGTLGRPDQELTDTNKVVVQTLLARLAAALEGASRQ